MSETNFNLQQDFDGFVEPVTERPVDLQQAQDSRQYPFTVDEAVEMREQAAVEQAQRAGEATAYLANPSFDVV